MTSSLSRIQLDEPIIPSNFTSKGASDFSATTGAEFKGLGMTSHLSIYDPVMLLQNNRVIKPSILVPNILDVFDKASICKWTHYLSDSIAINSDLSKVSETKGERTTQKLHLEKLVEIIPGMKTSTGDKHNSTLHYYGCNYGFASSNSVPDGIIINKLARGIYEVKDNTLTPAVATRQGISEATNLANRQLQVGVKFDDIMIPIVGSNGYLIEFSCLILFEPSFPVFVKLSKVLDLTDSTDLNIATKYFIKLDKFFKMEITTSTSPQYRLINNIGLSRNNYYLKSLGAFFCSKPDIDSSLFHYLKVMNHLYDKINENYKNFILFPLSIRIDGGLIRDGQIIFDKLHEQYWQIGLPIESNLKEKFITLLANIMSEIHSIGVVHLDLYPSNIMWRINPIDQNGILIKIIDWDSAHFTDEILEKHVIERLYDGRQTLKDNIGSNNINYDISLFNIIQKYKDRTDLQSNAKNVLDTAFKNYVLQEASAINEKYNK